MTAMDVTPQELRDTEIREAWRGYHRDDVDELLERAAATIERLQDQNRGLQQRLHAGPPAAVQAAAQPAPIAAPQPAPLPPPQPERVPVPDSDVIQRTLILAQKAADEAVADAQARARQMLDESESKAQSLVTEAEQAARRIAESERKRIEAEIQQLYSTREALTADVDALERFEHEYRERIRQAIEIELEQLTSTGTTALSRPGVSDVALPGVPAPAAINAAESTPGEAKVASPGPAPTPTSTPSPTPAPAVTPSPAPAPSEASAPWSAEPGPEPTRAEASRIDASRGGPPTVALDAVEAYPQNGAVATAAAWDAPASRADWAPEPAGGWGESPGITIEDDSGEYALPVDERRDSLDDDAFFASLREAVRDDAPLGPRDGLYDQDESDEHRRLFRRKR
jgi:DivIVA domain-containing protein